MDRTILPTRWQTPVDAQDYLDARLRDLDKAKEMAKASPSWDARSHAVLRLGVALGASEAVAASGHITASRYLELRLTLTGKRGDEVIDVRQPKRWREPEAVRGYIKLHLEQLERARAQVHTPLQSLKSRGTQDPQRQIYIESLLALGAALNAVACAYCGWWIEQPEYEERRREVCGGRKG